MRWSSGAFITGLIVAMMVVAGAPVAAQAPDDLDVAPIVVQQCCAQQGKLVTGRSWTPGDEIDLLVNSEYVMTAVVDGDGVVTFEVDATGVEVFGGDVVELTDGVRSDVHVVAPLTVSRMDVATEVITGTIDPPGSSVLVFVPDTDVTRVVTSDATGAWTTDLSTPGPGLGEEAVTDVDVFSVVAAARFDTDGNATLWEAQPAGDYSPIIVIVEGADLWFETGPQLASGQTWGVGDEVELWIDGAYVTTSIAEQNGEGSATPWYDLSALGVSVAAGDEVTLALADGSRTEIHVVTALSVTDVDLDADTVAGTAEPGTLVAVRVGVALGVAGAGRLVDADVDGDWLADFSVPGDEPGEQSVADLVADSSGIAFQFDEAGNGTWALWAASRTDKEACKKDGWQEFGFRNQGQCVRSVVAQP